MHVNDVIVNASPISACRPIARGRIGPRRGIHEPRGQRDLPDTEQAERERDEQRRDAEIQPGIRREAFRFAAPNATASETDRREREDDAESIDERIDHRRSSSTPSFLIVLFVKNETVIGTIGNTQGVSSDSAPMTRPAYIRAESAGAGGRHVGDDG